MGVLKSPYSFWAGDPKINPPAKQLLWAAILLQDREQFNTVEAVITTELEERQRARGEPIQIHELPERVHQLIGKYIREFIDLAPHEPFREELGRKAHRLSPVNKGKTNRE
jgi:hypothetical protein